MALQLADEAPNRRTDSLTSLLRVVQQEAAILVRDPDMKLVLAHVRGAERHELTRALSLSSSISQKARLHREYLRRGFLLGSAPPHGMGIAKHNKSRGARSVSKAPDRSWSNDD